MKYYWFYKQFLAMFVVSFRHVFMWFVVLLNLTASPTCVCAGRMLVVCLCKPKIRPCPHLGAMTQIDINSRKFFLVAKDESEFPSLLQDQAYLNRCLGNILIKNRCT